MMASLAEEKKEGGAVIASSSGSAASPHVYVRHKDHSWIPARVRSVDVASQQAMVTVNLYEDEQSILHCKDEGDITEFAVALGEYADGVLPLQNTTQSGELLQYEDMAEMSYLHEAAILYNLKQRHVEGKPYTRSGDVIVAMNPYQWFYHLYHPEEQQYYANKLLWDNLSTDMHQEGAVQSAKGVAPHVYETATLAYQGMALWNHSQSILVSGESGAGKTETVKICMGHIATLQSGPYADLTRTHATVVERVLEANPLLEAFGNAQTRRNDNSSRFGKFTQLQFDRHNMIHKIDMADSPAQLVGSTCEVYLLEKNRVVSHDAAEERTFHIFYELLAAPPREQAKIWKELKGANPYSFSYVGASKTRSIEGKTDGERFSQTMLALDVLGIPASHVMDLMRSLCVVLQLGNLTFAPDPREDDKSIITSDKELESLGALVGLDKQKIRLALTQRTMRAKDDVYKVPLTAAAAKESCDGLAKDIYEKVFLWLVRTINQATCATSNNGHQFGTVGLLDIFGFEAFFVNRFEQLCINYANEKLQSKFTEDCFKLLQREYMAQGIPLEHIAYYDNTDVLDLIEGKTGLLAMLNEECWRPQGNAASFVNKALHENKDSPCLIVNTLDRLSFAVHHYAGKVLYDADDFVNRNQDRLPLDLKQCASMMSNPIISSEYQEVVAEAIAEVEAGGPSSNSNIKAKTVWTKYRSQLSRLMADLKKTESRYIRCLKPNTHKKPLLFDHNLTVSQLRSCGIVASVTIARSAFPNRMENRNVLTRFGGIWHQKGKIASAPAIQKSGEEQWKAKAQALLSFALNSMTYADPVTGRIGPCFVVGKTKTFFRAGALEYLETERLNGLGQQAAIIQRGARAFLKQKQAILAARALRRRIVNHRRMAEERRARKQAEERAKQGAAAREEEEFQLRMAAEWDAFHALMAEEDRRVHSELEAEDAKLQAQSDAEIQAWKEKMDRDEQEFAKKLAEEQNHGAFTKDDELARLRAEIAALQKQTVDIDREHAEKVKALDEGFQQARKERREYDKNMWRHGVGVFLEDRELKDMMIICRATLDEREKIIKLLEKEKKWLGKAFERAEDKKNALIEINRKLEEQCMDASVKFEKTRRLSMSMNLVIDERQLAYEAAKAKNQALRVEIAKEQERFSAISVCNLELQQTLSKIVEIVQSESTDQDLRDKVISEIISTSKAAYKQMKVVKELQDHAKNDEKYQHSVSDFNQSWTAVH